MIALGCLIGVLADLLLISAAAPRGGAVQPAVLAAAFLAGPTAILGAFAVVYLLLAIAQHYPSGKRVFHQIERRLGAEHRVDSPDR